jgi:hypothetical protein
MRQNHDEREQERQSYLSLIPTFSEDFAGAARKGFQHLLQFPPLERGYLAGGLLIVPISEYSMQERYLMEIEDIFEQRETGKDLLASMYALSRDPRYHESVQMVIRDAIAFIEYLKRMAKENVRTLYPANTSSCPTKSISSICFSQAKRWQNKSEAYLASWIHSTTPSLVS